MRSEIEPEFFKMGEGFDGRWRVEIGIKERGGVGAEAGFVFGVEFFIGAEDGFAMGFGHAIDRHWHELPELGSKEFVVVSKNFGEGFGSRGTDMADAHPGEEFGEASGFGCFDRGEEILDFLFAHAIEFEELLAMILEGVDVGEVVQGDIRCPDEVDGGFTEGVDVHLASAHKPDEFLTNLGGAFGIHASAGGFEGWVFDGLRWFDFERRIAVGAVVWGEDLLCIVGALVEDDTHNLGDDFARLFDLDRIADMEVSLADHAVVVEGGVLDFGACEENRLEGGARGDLAGFADLVIDGEKLRSLAFGGELVGNDPAGGFGGVAKGGLLGEGIDADDDAIGCVVEIVAECADVVDGFDDFVSGNGL